MKICRECKKNIDKPVLTKDGYYRKSCRDCIRKYNLKYQKDNKDRITKVNKEYRLKNFDRLEKLRKIFAKKNIKNHIESNRKWRKNNPEKYKAQMILGHAIERYGFKKQPCFICGTTKNVHTHHKDYSKPLDVDWYCPKHHKEVHAL